MTVERIGRSIDIFTVIKVYDYFDIETTGDPSRSKPTPSGMMSSPTDKPSVTIYSLPLFRGIVVTDLDFATPFSTVYTNIVS